MRTDVRALSDRILAGPTATAALLDWCERHGIAEGPIRVVHLRGHRRPDPGQAAREALQLDADERLAYRSVQLLRGDVPLAWAENWFVPDRLPAPIGRALESSDVPFGRVVAPLWPRRRNLAVRFIGLETRGRSGATVLEHEAVLSDRHGRPLCLVHERYCAALLGQGAREHG